MIETIEFKGSVYPKFQSQGFAAKFAFPYAEQVCKGNGLDIGCNRHEWAFPGAVPVDPVLNLWDALNLPLLKDTDGWDYIFSSHCLEHIPNWVDAMDHWYEKLKQGGVLFLYLPHPSQEYWLPWNNRKHIHILRPEDIQAYMQDKGYKNIFRSGVDLNNSYMIFGEK